MLSQDLKNKMFKPMEKRLEQIENHLLRIGIDRDDPKSVDENNRYLKEYEEIQDAIGHIQFKL